MCCISTDICAASPQTCVCDSFIFRGKESSAKFQERSLTFAILGTEIVVEESNQCCVDGPANLYFPLIPSLL